MKLKDILLSGVTLFSPTMSTKILYRKRLGKKLNLKEPKTFNEKVQWLKLHEVNKKDIYVKCADKYLVREYVKECGCEEILTKLYGVYDDANDINWDELPNKFVLKWNFGCGLNIICKDKSKLDEQEVKRKLNKWKHNKFYLKTSEMQYKKMNKKIICEEYLCDSKSNTLDDYKIYCFYGEVGPVMICIGRDKGKPKFYYFDSKFNWLKEYSQDGLNTEKLEVEKPKCFDKMIGYAKKLSKPFPLVRVDLYIVDNKVYFGELTFTPAAGLDVEKTEIADVECSKRIKIK